MTSTPGIELHGGRSKTKCPPWWIYMDIFILELHILPIKPKSTLTAECLTEVNH